MKLPDVLKHGAVASGEMWFRPVTWRRTGAAYVALQMGRKFIGTELKESYFKIAAQNLMDAENVSQKSLF